MTTYMATSTLTFQVRRNAPELIAPAAPTPRELKPLSDIDDQEGLRSQIPGIQFYPSDPKMADRNPAAVIRDALAKLLVFYYPLAGRLKEGPCRKLMVDCTGEGVLFIEAEADVTLKQFGEMLHPPFPCLDELLYDVPGSGGIVDSPLLLIQVTRLLCGGFIVATRNNHTISDGQGVVQFLTALGEIARGAVMPSILPVWKRELLFARDPPCITFRHLEYEETTNAKRANTTTIETTDEMSQKSFFFGPAEIPAIRRFVPEHLKRCSTFEVLTACIWRCRTIALQRDPEDEVRLMFSVNVRGKLNPPIPVGYYGNCIVDICTISTVGDLCNKPLGHAIELVMKAKSIICDEYVRSTTDLMIIKGRPPHNFKGTFSVLDLTRAGFNDVDFGWGKATYGGPARAGYNSLPGVSLYTSSRNNKGESGIIIPLCLPIQAMEKFLNELAKCLCNTMIAQNKRGVQSRLLVPKSSQMDLI